MIVVMFFGNTFDNYKEKYSQWANINLNLMHILGSYKLKEAHQVFRITWGIHSYMDRILTFPLRYCEFYNYIGDNLEQVYLMTTDRHRLNDTLNETVEYNKDNNLNLCMKIVRKVCYYSIFEHKNVSK